MDLVDAGDLSAADSPQIQRPPPPGLPEISLPQRGNPRILNR
jgi:hypothetical protein